MPLGMNWSSKPFVLSPTDQKGVDRPLTAAAQIFCQDHITFLSSEVPSSIIHRNICNLSLRFVHETV